MDQSTGLGDGTATITRTCSSFKLLAHQHPTQATSLFVTVDGGAAVVWDVPAGAGVAQWTSAALTVAAHTVQVKARSNKACYFEGGMFFNGDETTGIRLWDGAKSGTRADQFNAETANGALWADSLGHMTPDLLIVEWITTTRSCAPLPSTRHRCGQW